MFGRSFTLLTDYEPLLSILNAKANIPSTAAACMQHWTIFLSAYDYSIEFKSTREHTNADSPSHLPVEEDNDLDVLVAMFKVSFINDLPVTSADIAAATVKDPILTQVCQYVLEGLALIGMKENLCVFH